ncbi:MAG: hypothetical protein HY900_38095 [Deltaproteobacteria bacterium]|nr:hypothetical protein [Deltaproteobacteria bacterium]
MPLLALPLLGRLLCLLPRTLNLLAELVEELTRFGLTPVGGTAELPYDPVIQLRRLASARLLLLGLPQVLDARVAKLSDGVRDRSGGLFAGLLESLGELGEGAPEFSTRRIVNPTRLVGGGGVDPLYAGDRLA